MLKASWPRGYREYLNFGSILWVALFLFITPCTQTETNEENVSMGMNVVQAIFRENEVTLTFSETNSPKRFR